MVLKNCGGERLWGLMMVVEGEGWEVKWWWKVKGGK